MCLHSGHAAKSLPLILNKNRKLSALINHLRKYFHCYGAQDVDIPPLKWQQKCLHSFHSLTALFRISSLAHETFGTWHVFNGEGEEQNVCVRFHRCRRKYFYSREKKLLDNEPKMAKQLKVVGSFLKHQEKGEWRHRILVRERIKDS